MKIHNLFPSLPYRETVKRKDNLSDGNPQQQAQQQQSGRKEKDEEDKELSFDAVAEQLEQFSSENSVHLKGISASVDGSGPGLTVVLKDGKGAVVRQLSGEEFMEMRATAKLSGRGNLIDKKL